MRAHAETIGNRLELFLLFVNAGAFAPEPGLMHERAVRRIHQADDALVDMRGKVAGEMRDFVSFAEDGKSGRRRRRITSCSAAARG